MKRIPVCEPYLAGREAEYVNACLRGNWISSRGSYIDEFEAGFARYCGCRFGVTTTSGTTALHLALAALSIGPGDEVIVPTFTMASTVFAILYVGATPVLVDSNPETWTIDVEGIERKITPQTRAIMPVHIYGHACDMDPVLDIASRHDLVVLEDAAEAHGAEYKGRRLGGLGRASCFSFYANKIVTTGEGGMVVTSDEAVADRARALRDLGFSREKRFLHDSVGFNYRMTNLQAAIGLAQLENIDRFVDMRRRHAGLYTAHLSGLRGVVLPPEKPWAKNVYWMYGILLTEAAPVGRDELREALAAHGIETRTFFFGMHEQPALRKRGLFAGEAFPVADALARQGLYLPSGTGLRESEIGYVCDTIRAVLGGRASAARPAAHPARPETRS
jgi:perosamine synthetase